jgi:iron complex transport system ATP-binding protein
MVMIARALAQDTPVILLDEPTAHLDLNNRVRIMKLLLKIARDTQKAILVSTHELDLALQLADWIWLAGAERSMITGIPEDLVLNGSFDAIFRLKGFDLKTGKVEHQPGSDIIIRLADTGPEYWWTKNALERNGFRVSEAPSSCEVIIVRTMGSLQWQLVKNGIASTFTTLSELLNSLDQTIARGLK